MEPVRAAAEATIRALPGVKTVLVGLTAEKAPSRAAAPLAPRNRARRRGPPSLPGVKHIIAVASGKGGVGKSTTACNLALGACGAGPEGRPSRRRHLRPVACRSCSACAASRSSSAGRMLEPMDALRRQGHVDRLPGRRGDGDDLARPDGDVGHHADAARSRLGRARRARRRHAARHRRRAAHHGAGRRRSPAPSSSRRRRTSRCIDARRGVAMFQQGRGADPRHRREHGDLLLPALRPQSRRSSAMAARATRPSGSACRSSAKCRST